MLEAQTSNEGKASDRPKVIHVITESFSAHLFLKPLASYLSEHGWDSVIVCSAQSYDDAHSYSEELCLQGFDVRDFAIRRRIAPIADLCQVVKVSRLIRREDPTLVHSHLAKGGMIGRIAAFAAGVPCVHTVYDYAFVEHRGLRRKLYRGIERLGALLAQRILFVSENERELSAAAGIGRSDQLVNIGFGVDTVLFNPARVTQTQVRAVKRRFGVPENSLVVGTVARLIRRKGIDLLIEAMAILARRQTDVHLLVVGGGPILRDLVVMASELKVAGRVSFAGFVDSQLEMPAIFRAMDVFCLPSRREGYGMVYAEAGAMNRPVVAPNIEPIDSIVVHGKTGLLVSPENSTEIANALQRLLSNRGLRMSMGHEAGVFVRRHCDLRASCSRVLESYNEVLGIETSRPLANKTAD